MELLGWFIMVGGLIWLAILFPFLWIIYAILFGLGLMSRD